jgi:hypothetical protein
LAKTLRELQNTPEWPSLYPEIYSALEELQGKFRQTHLALASSIAPFRMAIPQIELPVLPDRFHDLLAVLRGDREAIARTIPAPKKVDSDPWGEAVLEVLSNTRDVLPVYIYRDGRTNPWHDTNGQLNSTTPENWLIEEVWRWLKAEAITAVNCRLRNEPYKPSVLFSEEPSEDNPLPLWLPTESGQLIAPDKGGAPPGPRDFKDGPNFYFRSRPQ